MTPKRLNAYDIQQLFSSEAEQLLLRHGEDRETARQGAEAFVDKLATLLGGLQIYVPKFVIGQKIETVASDANLSTSTLQEIALRHGISTVRTYQILKASASIRTSKETHTLTQAIAIEGARLLLEQGLAVQDAAEAARGFASILMTRLAGQHIYLPRNLLVKERKKYEEIAVLYKNGMSPSDIAPRYGLTVSRIGQILKQQGFSPSNRRGSLLSLLGLKQKLVAAAESYSDENEQGREVNSLLTSAANNVSQAWAIVADIGNHQQGVNNEK